MSVSIALVLVAIALLGGVCITTIGPGGIFVTIALFVVAGLDPGAAAGTASATFIATGVAGSVAYLRSGELATAAAARAALVLSLASVGGALTGVYLNAQLDARDFGVVMGGFIILAAIAVHAQRRKVLKTLVRIELTSWRGGAAIAGIGLLVGLSGGLLGVGGPVLAVPALIVLGVPMLSAVALAQVQSIFIASFATVGYATRGAVDWKLAIALGIPLLVGTLAGWWIARRTQASRLRGALVVVLWALGVYLIVAGGVPR